MIVFFCFKQKTAYEMRISDWSSDVCSSDLLIPEHDESVAVVQIAAELRQLLLERVCGVVQLCPEIKSPGDRVRPAFQNIVDYIGSITVDHRVGWQVSHRPHGGRFHPGATGIAHTLQIGFMSPIRSAHDMTCQNDSCQDHECLPNAFHR